MSKQNEKGSGPSDKGKEKVSQAKESPRAGSSSGLNNSGPSAASGHDLYPSNRPYPTEDGPNPVTNDGTTGQDVGGKPIKTTLVWGHRQSPEGRVSVPVASTSAGVVTSPPGNVPIEKSKCFKRWLPKAVTHPEGGSATANQGSKAESKSKTGGKGQERRKTAKPKGGRVKNGQTVLLYQIHDELAKIQGQKDAEREMSEDDSQSDDSSQDADSSIHQHSNTGSKREPTVEEDEDQRYVRRVDTDDMHLMDKSGNTPVPHDYLLSGTTEGFPSKDIFFYEPTSRGNTWKWLGCASGALGLASKLFSELPKDIRMPSLLGFAELAGKYAAKAHGLTLVYGKPPTQLDKICGFAVDALYPRGDLVDRVAYNFDQLVPKYLAFAPFAWVGRAITWTARQVLNVIPTKISIPHPERFLFGACLLTGLLAGWFYLQKGEIKHNYSFMPGSLDNQDKIESFIDINGKLQTRGDMRPDAQALKEIKHRRPLYATYYYSATHENQWTRALDSIASFPLLGDIYIACEDTMYEIYNRICIHHQYQPQANWAWWRRRPRQTPIRVSVELLAQALNPRNLSFIDDPSVVAANIVTSTSNLHTIALNKLSPVHRVYIVQNTQKLAYAYYRDMMREQEMLPFHSAPAQ